MSKVLMLDRAVANVSDSLSQFCQARGDTLAAQLEAAGRSLGLLSLLSGIAPAVLLCLQSLVLVAVLSEANGSRGNEPLGIGVFVGLGLFLCVALAVVVVTLVTALRLRKQFEQMKSDLRKDLVAIMGKAEVTLDG